MPILEVEAPNAAVDLQFKMEGPAFDRGMPLPLMVDSLGHVQGVLDKSYLGLIGKRRLSREERLRFYLQAQRIEHSSLLADLGVVFTGAQTVLPLFGVLGPSGIWEYAKSAFEFLKFVFEAVRKGERVTYTWNADRSVVHVNTGTQTQVFNGPVFNIGELSLVHYQGLTQVLDASNVTDIRLGEKAHPEIKLALPDRGLFELPTKIEEQPHKIACEILEFDKIERDGRMKVLPSQSIPEADYRFDVIGKQDAASYIEGMLKQQVRVTCLREVAENPVSGEKIYRLQLIDIEA
ncbi:MAG: hypothetical protein Q8S02_10350 [Hydrogenophaga sp.]|nr:hypothetical protein [Hydrogenophaga sp.]